MSQEAVATGVHAALKPSDDIVSGYRIHGFRYLWGGSVHMVLGELFGYSCGSSHGKGGSMHLYSRKDHFWGGHGQYGPMCV